MTNKALSWAIFWVSLSAVFCGYLSLVYGADIAITYAVCYGIEKLLSLDNLLMFYVIFRYFEVPPSKQKLALNIGIISSFILRGLMIFSGGFLVHKYPWLSYIFGGFLLLSGMQLFLQKDDDNSEPNGVINFVRKWMPWLSVFGMIIAIVELTDVMFAMDSIPASFGITSNPLIIYSANIFAILGLRSLYFVMLDVIERFTWLNKAVAIVLSCVGIKMVIQTYMGI